MERPVKLSELIGIFFTFVASLLTAGFVFGTRLATVETNTNTNSIQINEIKSAANNLLTISLVTKDMNTKIGFIGQGEKAWDAFARPCQVFLEFANRNIDKVYCSCTSVLELHLHLLNTSKLLFKALVCSSKEGLDKGFNNNKV